MLKHLAIPAVAFSTSASVNASGLDVMCFSYVMCGGVIEQNKFK